MRRALAALFGGAIGKEVVSRTWRKVKTDWDAWNVRPLANEPIVRLILDGTVVRVKLDRKALRSRCWWSSACARTARRSCLQSVPAQMTAEVPCGGRQHGGSRRASLRLYPAATEPMEKRADNQCH